MLAKLNMRSRSQVAAWAAQRRGPGRWTAPSWSHDGARLAPCSTVCVC